MTDKTDPPRIVEDEALDAVAGGIIAKAITSNDVIESPEGGSSTSNTGRTHTGGIQVALGDGSVRGFN